MDPDAMQRFWDERAREDAYFFVDTDQAYGAPDLERLWAAGEESLAVLLETGGVGLRGDEVVVEIGCGVGRLTRALAPRAAEVIALDISEEMLALAQRHHPDLVNVRWVHSDGLALTRVGDASADACISHVVFQHLPDPAITLGYVREMGRVLRPGGWSVFQFSNVPDLHAEHVPRLSDRLRGALGRGPRGRTNPAWVGSGVALDALTAAAQDAGLEVERIAHEGTMYCVAFLRRSARAA